jgi:hypothetical protein
MEAIYANRSENAPFTRQSSRPCGSARMPASIIPVAELVLMSTGRLVLKTDRRPRCRRSKSCSNSGPRCGIIGFVIAARIWGRTSVGPGRKKVPKDLFM